jgi:hypothetical protein
MDVNNLTNVYNQNPTLQSNYTLQQYLDLFGGSSTPPPATIQPVPTPNVPETGIINQNINQYQGGGGGGGIQGLTLNAPRTARAAPINSAAFRDPLNEKIANQMRTQNPNLESRTNAEIIASNPDMFDIKTDRGFFQNTVDNIGSGIGSAYKAFKESPIGIGMSFLNPASALASVAGMMGRKDLSDLDVAFNKSGDTYTSAGGIGGKDKYGINKESLLGNYAAFVGKKSVDLEDAYAAAIDKLSKMGLTPAQIAKRTKDLKERNDYYQKQKERQEKQRMEAEAATAARARARNAAVYASADRQGFTNSQGGFSTSAADKAGTSEGSGQFSSRSGRGRTGYRYGGRTSYFNGGIVSLRRR